jgi:bifunctional DNase/RNase
MQTMVASWLALDESAPIFVEEEVDEEWEDDEDEDLEEDEE